MKLCATCDSVVPNRVCPHCGATVRSGARSTSLVHVLGLVVASMAAPACATSLYGIVGVGGDDDADLDRDGWNIPLDCDDSDPDINPGAIETAGDGVDSDCDGSDDPQA